MESKIADLNKYINEVLKEADLLEEFKWDGTSYFKEALSKPFKEHTSIPDVAKWLENVLFNEVYPLSEELYKEMIKVHGADIYVLDIFEYGKYSIGFTTKNRPAHRSKYNMWDYVYVYPPSYPNTKPIIKLRESEQFTSIKEFIDYLYKNL